MRLPSAQEIQRVTGEILRRPEFRPPEEPTGQAPGWLDRLADWLAALHLPVSAELAGLILKGLLVALIAAAAFYLARWLAREWKARPDAPRGTGRLSSAGLRREDAAEDPADLLRQAEQALEAGDARAAVRLLYAALLWRLNRSGLIRSERWKTNQSYLAECPRQAEPYALLQRLTAAYDDIVYAHRPRSAGELTRLIGEVGSCKEPG